MILEDQLDLSFLGVLPSQILPLGQRHMDIDLFSLVCFLVSCHVLAEHLYLLVRYLGSLLSLSSLRTRRSMRALFKERKKKRWTKYYQKKREKFSICTINIQHDTHSLSWWSRGTGLSSWSRRTLVKVLHKFM